MPAAWDVHVESYADPLTAIRRVLTGADEVLAGVAFVRQSGVNLLAPQLKPLAMGRLVTTTVFGSTTSDGLAAARDAGVGVRVLNPVGGTFHPKLYLGRHGEPIAAAVGSANLTSGLVANVEVVAVLEGPATAPPLRKLWDLAESWWAHPSAVDWAPAAIIAPREELTPALLAMIRAALAGDPIVMTLGPRPQRNVVHEVTPDGVWVETAASRAKSRSPQPVPAAMIQLAWDALQSHGGLTNRYLPAADGLNVKRSSFVCALLARLPGVEVSLSRHIELRATTVVLGLESVTEA